MEQGPDPVPFTYSNYAVEVSTGRLLTLHGADRELVAEMKARCQALEVICPVADCQAPELSATTGYVRADGTAVTAYFSHRSGGGDGGHGPASYAHAQIIHALRDWADGLGFEAAVGVWIPGVGRAVDVAIDGPGHFAVEVQRSPVTVDERRERNADLSEAGLKPLWLWMAAGGGCPSEVDLDRVGGDHEDLADIWLAGVDGGGEVKLAVVTGPSSASGSAIDGGRQPARCTPAWRDLAEIDLDANGFVAPSPVDVAPVDLAPVDLAPVGPVRPEAADSRPFPGWEGGRPQPDSGSGPAGEGRLFGDEVAAGSGRFDWSPEELSTPGTRWLRTILHDRRHQAFLAGLDDLCAYDRGTPEDRST